MTPGDTVYLHQDTTMYQVIIYHLSVTDRRPDVRTDIPILQSLREGKHGLYYDNL